MIGECLAIEAGVGDWVGGEHPHIGSGKGGGDRELVEEKLGRGITFQV